MRPTCLRFREGAEGGASVRVGASVVWPGQCGDRAVSPGAAGEALRVSSVKLGHSAQPCAGLGCYSWRRSFRASLGLVGYLIYFIFVCVLILKIRNIIWNLVILVLFLSRCVLKEHSFCSLIPIFWQNYWLRGGEQSFIMWRHVQWPSAKQYIKNDPCLCRILVRFILTFTIMLHTRLTCIWWLSLWV